MRILHRIPHPKGLGADRWIYEGWKDAFTDLGHEFYELGLYESLEEKVTEVHPDIFWTGSNFGIIKKKGVLKSIRRQGVRVFLMVDWPRIKEEIEVLKTEQIADIYFGEREPESMIEFGKATGRKYHLIPNAANKKLHFPAAPQSKYEYDIVFLGAKLPKKRWFFDNVLMPLTKKYNVGIFGPYWSFGDNLERVGSKLFRRMNIKWAADFIDKRRVLIPSEEENQLYSSTKICLNFHERAKDGTQPHYIINQRAFKIPACGGFQICDHVPALRKYFAEDEVVMAKIDKNDWFEKIEYYLEHEDERKAIQRKGTERALRDHTYHRRVEQVVELYHSI